MNYRDYVIGAYVVFAVILLWDYVVPRLQVRSALRAAKLHTNRAALPKPSMELER